MPSVADLYPKMLARINVALAALTDYTLDDADGIAGLIWTGCETDASGPTYASDIAANLATFVAQFRADVGAPHLPVTISRLSDLQTALSDLATGQAQQDLFVASDPYATSVNTDADHGVTIQQTDLTHFDACGQQRRGDLIAQSKDPAAAPARTQTRAITAVFSGTTNWRRYPETTAARWCLSAAGGGAKTATGGGGGGACVSGDKSALNEDIYSVTVPGASFADTDGADATITSFAIGTMFASAAGGKSCTNGGAGGSVVDCITTAGLTAYAGGNAATGAGFVNGGGGAGQLSAAVLNVPGEPDGGRSTNSGAGARVYAAGGGSGASAQQGGSRGRMWIARDENLPSGGYPPIRSRKWGRSLATGTTLNVSILSMTDGGGDPLPGDTLLIIASATNAPVMGSTGSTATTPVKPQASDSTSKVTLASWTMTATGGGADTVALTTDSSQTVDYEVICFNGAATIEATTAVGSATASFISSPTHAPTAGSGPYLVISVVSTYGNVIGAVNSIPSGYSSSVQVVHGQIGPSLGTYQDSAEAFLTGSSFSPGTFAVNSPSVWAAATFSAKAA